MGGGHGGCWGDTWGNAGQLAAKAGVLSLCPWTCVYRPWQQSFWEPRGTKRVLNTNQIGWKEKGETLGPSRLPLVWAFHLQVTRSGISNKPCTCLTDGRKAAASRLTVEVLSEMRGLKRALKKCFLTYTANYNLPLWRNHWKSFCLKKTWENCSQKNSLSVEYMVHHRTLRRPKD